MGYTLPCLALVDKEHGLLEWFWKSLCLHLQDCGQPRARGCEGKEESGREGKGGKAHQIHPPAAASSFPSCGPHIVVHCSAGVRRSGTFCTLDYCIDELHAQQKVSVQGAVRRLQMQCAYAIQIHDQYAFCYKTMLEYARTSHKNSHRRTQRCISGEFVDYYALCMYTLLVWCITITSFMT